MARTTEQPDLDYVSRCSLKLTKELWGMGGGSFRVTKAIKEHIDGRKENRLLNWEGVVEKKEFEVLRAMMASAKFCCSYLSENANDRKGIYVSSGPRCTADEHSMVAGLHMIIPSDVADRSLAREFSRSLGIHRRRVLQIAAQKKNMDDLAVRHWVIVTKGTYRNKIPSRVDQLIDAWLHGDVASRIDNNRKVPVKIYTGEVDEQNRLAYELHHKRVLRGDAYFLFRLLTGRNRRGEEDLGPTETWRQVIELTRLSSRLVPVL
jgi:hypothetical protein